MCGARSTGSPMTSTSGTSSRHRRSRIRSTRADGRRCSSSRLLGSRRAQRGRRGDDRRHVLEPRHPPALPLVLRAAASATACPCGPPARPPRRGRPTCARCRSAPTSPAGTGSRPSRLRGVDQQRHAGPRGRPRPPRATGCSVPTSWLAVCRQASAVPGPRTPPRRTRPASTRPVRLTPTISHRRRRRARGPAAACSTLECSTALTTRRRPTRRRAVSAPSTPRWIACVPEVVKETSSGRAPSASATSARACSSSRRARRACAVQPRRVGPAGVDGREQRLAGPGVQRFGGGRVEVRHASIAPTRRATPAQGGAAGPREGDPWQALMCPVRDWMP